METEKAYSRRLREQFFDKYCQGKGIDIGCGKDPINNNCDKWDKDQGDATYMKGVADESYDYVYSSHCLEHLDKPDIAIQNWFRILKTDGFLIVCVPHRDLYEKKMSLPSRYNRDHRFFFLIDKYEHPCTIGLIPFVEKNLKNYDIEYIKKCNDGWISNSFIEHSLGEFSIELVLKKV